MARLRNLAAVLVLLSTMVASRAADPVVGVASGVVHKVATNLLIIRPRGPDGKFEKLLALSQSGTSKVSMLSIQKRGDAEVPVQRDADIRDLKPNQPVAVIYTL